jgi:hypothetical protein
MPEKQRFFVFQNTFSSLWRRFFVNGQNRISSDYKERFMPILRLDKEARQSTAYCSTPAQKNSHLCKNLQSLVF